MHVALVEFPIEAHSADYNLLVAMHSLPGYSADLKNKNVNLVKTF